MKLSVQDVRTLDASARKAFDELDRCLKAARPSVVTDFGCTTGLGVRLFSYVRVRLPEPIVLGITVLQAVPEGLVVHADAVEDDTGHILLAEPVETLRRPTMGLLQEAVATLSTRLCRRAIEGDLFSPRLPT